MQGEKGRLQGLGGGDMGRERFSGRRDRLQGGGEVMLEGVISFGWGELK